MYVYKRKLIFNLIWDLFFNIVTKKLITVIDVKVDMKFTFFTLVRV